MSPAEATVIIAQPASNTVMVDSSLILSKSASQAVLANTPATAQIKTGDIIASGNKAGLLVKVNSVQNSGNTLLVNTTPVSLPEAFKNLNINISSLPVTLTLVVSNGRASLVSPTGQVMPLNRAALGGFTCVDDKSGSAVQANYTGPTVTLPVPTNLHLELSTTGSTLPPFYSLQSFSLLVHMQIPAKLTFGSINFSAANNVGFTCTMPIGSIDIPALDIGPFTIGGHLAAELGVKVDATANGQYTITLPTIADTLTADDGVEWNSTSGWQAITNNSSSGQTVTTPGSEFSSSIEGSVGAYLDCKAGIDLSTLLGGDLGGVDLAYAEIAGTMNLGIQAPFNVTSNGYTGPKWAAKLEVTAGPTLQISGSITQLFNYLGLSTNLGSWNLYDQSYPLGQSPMPVIQASQSQITPGTPVTFTLTAVPPAAAGDAIKLYAYKAKGTVGTEIGTGIVSSTGSTTITWTPTAAQIGNYEVVQAIYDNVFGQLNLPYASTPIPISVVPSGGVSVGIQ